MVSLSQQGALRSPERHAACLRSASGRRRNLTAGFPRGRGTAVCRCRSAAVRQAARRWPRNRHRLSGECAVGGGASWPQLSSSGPPNPRSRLRGPQSDRPKARRLAVPVRNSRQRFARTSARPIAAGGSDTVSSGRACRRHLRGSSMPSRPRSIFLSR